MSPDPDLLELSRPPKRPPHMVRSIVVCWTAAYLAGACVVVVVNWPHITGSRTDPFVYLFGLPSLGSVPGAVLGAILALVRFADDRDEPVRVDGHGDVTFEPATLSATADRPPLRDPRAGRPRVIGDATRPASRPRRSGSGRPISVPRSRAGR
jgi:hypothetical protein